MKTLLYLLVSFIWLPMIALAAWWAGFMPFPTRPEEIGWKSESFDGLKGSEKATKSIISARDAREGAKKSPYGGTSWYCEPDNKDHCFMYSTMDEPFFGWTSPKWVLTFNGMVTGTSPVAFYGTYAACKWNEDRQGKGFDAQRVSYERWAIEQHQKIEDQEFKWYSCIRSPNVAGAID